MVDAMDPNGLCLIVDTVEEAVGATAGTVVASQLTPKWLTGAARFPRQVTESELDDRCQDARR